MMKINDWINFGGKIIDKARYVTNTLNECYECNEYYECYECNNNEKNKWNLEWLLTSQVRILFNNEVGGL